MASRAQILSDPRSGASEGATRRPRPAPDQGTRDALEAARAASRRRSGRLPSPRAGHDASAGPGRDATSPSSAGPSAGPSSARRPRRPPPAYDEILAGERTRAEQADFRRRAREQVAGERFENQPELAGPAPAPRSFAHEGAGALLALIVYPLAINFLRGGNAQMIGWVKAKWLNQPYATGAPVSKSKPPATPANRGMSATTAHYVTGGA